MGLTVAAARDLAVGQAVVGLDRIAVVAVLKAFVVLSEVLAQKSIAAGRRLTRIRARIDVRPIAIIAGLTGVDDGVATSLTNARCRAPVTGFFVAIITLLKTFSAPLKTAPQNTIATASDTTGIGAGIARLRVAVVTSLERLTLVIKVGSYNAITAGCWRTQVGAPVGIYIVAVIAALFRPNDSITANLWTTLITIIIRIIITVVATLT